MDITPQDATQQPMSDDQDLAKALAGVLPDEPETPAFPEINEEEVIAVPSIPGMQFEETPTPQAAPAAVPSLVGLGTPIDVNNTTPSSVPSFGIPEPASTPATSFSSDLESIKKTALDQLRPLIDHVDLPPVEKFDTYLMLLRSTDDASLIGPAHVAAQAITDEKRKAEALLDVIKEIDYLTRKDQPAA